MIIGVDAGCLGVRDERLKAGVYRLAKNLLRVLSKLDKKNSYRLYSFSAIEKELMNQLGERFTNVVLSPSKGFLKIRLPLEFIKVKPDIFLALGQATPPYHPFKTIGFIYDISFEKRPDLYGANYKHLSEITRGLAKIAGKIITISKASASAIEKFYKLKKEKLKVCYPGVDHQLFRRGGKTYSMEKPYFLFVGSLKKSKNIPKIMEAFSAFLKKGYDHNFLLIGGDYEKEQEIRQKIDELKIRERVIMKGVVDDKELAGIYRGAVALVSPSLSEGFGLPVMEAFSSGCPVITSNFGSMKEMGEGNALLVDPNDSEAISIAMESIYTNKGLRNSLIRKGLTKAKSYTWERFSEAVLEEISRLAP